ncbi:YgjP-like metallopeptidase domain-containing protein [Streptomyces sp. NPDC058409]|uniref:YgjP-like metallopeptidase domain-containing protein n=1 Tax=Streptomyces sp. NPDC058409 TaxID=3346484 RepID=UPI0036533FF0
MPASRAAGASGRGLVLVHELCHLRASRHGAAFRRQLRLVLPDADARETAFAAAEPELWRGAVR